MPHLGHGPALSLVVPSIGQTYFLAAGTTVLPADFFLVFLTFCFAADMVQVPGIDIPFILPTQHCAQTEWAAITNATPTSKLNNFFITSPLYFYSRIPLRTSRIHRVLFPDLGSTIT